MLRKRNRVWLWAKYKTLFEGRVIESGQTAFPPDSLEEFKDSWRQSGEGFTTIVKKDNVQELVGNHNTRQLIHADGV